MSSHLSTLGIPGPSGVDRSRALRPIAIALALLVLGSLLVFYALNRQEPWQFDSGTIGGVQADEAPVRSKTNAYGAEFTVIAPPPDSTVSLRLSLEAPANAPLDLTVDQVGSPFGIRGATSRVSYVERSTATYQRQGIGKGPPLPISSSPVTAGPGEVLDITLVLTMPDCRRSAGSTSADTVPVTYTTDGESSTTNVPLGYMVTLQHPQQCF